VTDIVERLRSDLVFFAIRKELQMLTDEAADEIERLREKCTKQAMILRRLNPENFPDTYFICGEMGEKDHNGMPAKIMVAPAYGVDWCQIYEKTERVIGPEW